MCIEKQHRFLFIHQITSWEWCEALLTENLRENNKDSGSALFYTRVVWEPCIHWFCKVKPGNIYVVRNPVFCFLPNILSCIQENWCSVDLINTDPLKLLIWCPKSLLSLFCGMESPPETESLVAPLLNIFGHPCLTSFSISPVELGLPHPNSTSGVACEAPQPGYW
jgi:hypothetical protein